MRSMNDEGTLLRRLRAHRFDELSSEMESHPSVDDCSPWSAPQCAVFYKRACAVGRSNKCYRINISAKSTEFTVKRRHGWRQGRCSLACQPAVSVVWSLWLQIDWLSTVYRPTCTRLPAVYTAGTSCLSSAWLRGVIVLQYTHYNILTCCFPWSLTVTKPLTVCWLWLREAHHQLRLFRRKPSARRCVWCRHSHKPWVGCASHAFRANREIKLTAEIDLVMRAVGWRRTYTVSKNWTRKRR